jgi:hypothetical protein
MGRPSDPSAIAIDRDNTGLMLIVLIEERNFQRVIGPNNQAARQRLADDWDDAKRQPCDGRLPAPFLARP